MDIAFYPEGTHFKVPNNQDGLIKMISKLQKYNAIRIACESSGNYEKLMLKMLRSAGYQVVVLDPKVVRYFILSKGIKAKTDKIDAQMIALYTANNEPLYKQYIRTEEDEILRDLIIIRYNFVEDLAREKKRLKQAYSQKSKDYIIQHMEYLKKEIKLVEEEIKKFINSNEQWKQKEKILMSIPGIGKTTAAALITEMPELGNIENKQAAALLGVVPYTKESGNFKGTTSITGGRFMLRKIFYRGALSASHGKSRLATYYQKHKLNGKKAKVSVVALMNKMISMANALLRKGEFWNPQFNC